jgi:hypothetical protein
MDKNEVRVGPSGPVKWRWYFEEGGGRFLPELIFTKTLLKLEGT